MHYLVHHDYLDRASYHGAKAESRRAFKRLMNKAFGGGFKRSHGKARASEVSAALVRSLGQHPIAHHLQMIHSPDGWNPKVGRHFGTEIVARALGLRYDHPPGQERLDEAAREPMSQADVAWAVWRAKTDADVYSAQALDDFSLRHYGSQRRKVIRFALSLVGKPYVWAGEWSTKSPAGYPYGTQHQGGFDCSGLVWYVLQRTSSSYSPIGRSYRGWRIAERSSADMAGTGRRVSFKKLRPADLVFFAPGGSGSGAAGVYHAGIYLGRGWMINSSGSSAGATLTYIGRGSWWKSQFAWGRHVLPG